MNLESLPWTVEPRGAAILLLQYNGCKISREKYSVTCMKANILP